MLLWRDVPMEVCSVQVMQIGRNEYAENRKARIRKLRLSLAENTSAKPV
jgi:hypothetical protein